VYDAVLAAQAKVGRSILPDVTSASLYFSVVATNAETSPTETVYYACKNAGATQSITLKLKASSYWYITVYGTEQSGVVGTGTDETTEAQAITRVSGAAIVSGTYNLYMEADGDIYEKTGTLTVSSGVVTSSDTKLAEQDGITISTSPVTTSTVLGKISLPFKLYTSTPVGYISVSYSPITNGAAHAASTTSSIVTNGDRTTVTDTVGFTPGTYDVDIAFRSDSTSTVDLYQYHETLTVWSNATSTWVNTVAGMYAGSGTTDAPYYLDVTNEKIAAFKRTTFYVAGTTETLRTYLPVGSDSTGTGSIFSPYATVEKAVSVILADATSYAGKDCQIIIDGTAENTTATSNAGVYISGATETLNFTIRNFATATAVIQNISTLDAATVPVLLVDGDNFTVTLQGVTINDSSAGSIGGNVTVATKNFIMSKAVIDGDVTLSTIDDHITLCTTDTTSSVKSIIPASLAYSWVMLKGVAEDLTTDASFTTLPTSFTLNSTFTTTNPYAVLGIDNTSGASSEGDIIIKRNTTVKVNTDALNYTIAVTTDGTSSTAITLGYSETSTDLTGNSSQQIFIGIKKSDNTPVTTGITAIQGNLFDSSGASSSLTVDDAAIYNPTFTIPNYIKGVKGSYTLEIDFTFNSTLYYAIIPITVS